MKYDHIVKKNEIYYRAGQEVPDDDFSPSGTVNQMKQDDFSQYMNPPVENVGELPIYKKSDIMSMKKENLVQLAKEHGVKNPEEMNGVDLKRVIISILRL